jgi:hypothetical protein
VLGSTGPTSGSIPPLTGCATIFARQTGSTLTTQPQAPGCSHGPRHPFLPAHHPPSPLLRLPRLFQVIILPVFPVLSPRRQFSPPPSCLVIPESSTTGPKYPYTTPFLLALDLDILFFWLPSFLGTPPFTQWPGDLTTGRASKRRLYRRPRLAKTSTLCLAMASTGRLSHQTFADT